MWPLPREQRATHFTVWPSDSRYVTGAFAVGDISGGAFNPAVAVGISVLGLSSWSNLWIFLVANFLGGAAAAGVFRLLNTEES